MSNKAAEPQMGQKGQKQQTDPIAQKNQLDRYGRKKELFRGYNAKEWEDRMFEINGAKNILRHKFVNSAESTINFVFVQNEMKLHQGLTLHLEDKMGQVVGYREQAAQENERMGLLFSGVGGKIRFQSEEIPQLTEQNLAVTTIEIPTAEPGQTAKAKISASLMDTVAIETMPGMRLELKNGQYTNVGSEETGALHFDTAVWYDGKQLADHVGLKYDDSGLQMEEGEKGLLDVNQFDFVKKKQEAIQEALQGDERFAGGELQLKLVLDKDKGIHFSMDGMYQKAAARIGQTEFHLKYAEGIPGHFRTAKEADAKFQENELYLQNVSIQENEVKGKKGKLTFHNNGQENITLQDVEIKEADTLWAGSGQGTLDHKAVKLTGIQLKQDQLLQADTAEMNIEGFTTHLQKYSYQAGKTNAYESAKVETKVYAGLDRENTDNANQKDKAEFLFAFSLAAGQIQDGSFEEDTKSEEILSHAHFIQKTIGDKNATEAIQMKRKIFTKDGFAELETETMQFQKEEGETAKIVGKGKFKLSEIPYTLTTRKGKVLEGIAYSPEEALEGIDYNIDSEGNLFADFEDEEAEMNLKKVLVKKFENGSESSIKQIKLSGLKIEDGYLKVSSLRMDLGSGIEQELGKKENTDTKAVKNLKDIFGECNFSATIANITENVQLTPKGIEIKQDDKYTLGTVGVEGLFGFLSGEIDYPEGTVGVSAEKGVETPEEPGFMNIKKLGNLAKGIYIPIPTTPLSVEIGIKPFASIGGKISAEISRGKSFGEPWLQEKEELTVKGGLEAEAKAGVEAFVGIAAGGRIASVDLKLNGKMEAEVKGSLELGTKLKKERGRKMQPEDDFKFSGGIEGGLKAGLSLSSDAKVLFWKKQLFEIKLAEKELGKLRFKGSGYKEKGAEGLGEGWNFEKMQFTAEFLKKKTQIDMEHGIKGSFTIRKAKLNKLENLLKNENESVKTAWSALEQLEEQKKNMMYVLDAGEKKALEIQIQFLTANLEKKIKKCEELLEEQEKLLSNIEEGEKNKLEIAERKWKDANIRDKEAFYMMQAAEKGGFKKENVVGHTDWKNERFKNAMAQLGIAMLLGEYESGETKFRSSAIQKQAASAEGEIPLEIDLDTFMKSKVLEQGLTIEGYIFRYPVGTESDMTYYDLLKKYPDLTIRELLQYAVAGKYKDRETNEEVVLADNGSILRDLLKACLKATISYREIPKNLSKWEQKKRESLYQQQYEQTKLNIETRFENVFEQSYKKSATEGFFQKPEDIWERIEQIASDKEKAQRRWQEAKKALQNTQNRLAKVRGKKTEYDSKLATLNDNALGALTHQKFDSAKARTAVNIMAEDYGKKIKDGQEILQGLSQNDPHKEMLETVLQAKEISTKVHEAARRAAAKIRKPLNA